MQIEFVGAARSVTGSCYIVKNGDFTIMVDRGMFQGNRALRDRNYLRSIHAPKEIDALLLTHAHIDHSGLIPRMVKDGYANQIFATRATVDLCAVMLPDSAHIQEMDTKWINKRNKRKGKDAVEPLYTVEHAEKSLQHFVPVNYGDMVDVVPGVKARFRDAGHILGSSFIELFVTEKGKTTKLVFSGDVGTKEQALIKDPETTDEADFLLVESTYGDRLHKSKEDTYREFREIIKQAYNQQGNIIIPSFAVERTQEIIYHLGRLFKEKAIPEMPVYIDSPLAISATEIFKMNKDCFDEETMKVIMSGDNPLEFKNLSYTRDAADSKMLNDIARGAIIISASGMCNAGRILYHLQNNLYRPESSVIFVGFQAEETLGRRLVDGEKKVRILGEDVVVQAKIHTLGGFSAHADRDGLVEWMGAIKSGIRRVFVVHGEEAASLSFADTVKEKFGHGAHVPQWGEIVDLETMESTFADYGAPAGKASESLDGEIEGLRSGLDHLMKKYQKVREDKSIRNADRLERQIDELKRMIKSLSDEM
ncbi:MAG: MBL fold metallo-hydrolase [Spirochaetes bacterium]|nr:MBL fold metallo-hydrolase [Spirochaetota bacterium]